MTTTVQKIKTINPLRTTTNGNVVWKVEFHDYPTMHTRANGQFQHVTNMWDDEWVRLEFTGRTITRLDRLKGWHRPLIEVEGCVGVVTENDAFIKVVEDEYAAFWGVYIRTWESEDLSEAEWLSDHPTRDQAEAIADVYRNLLDRSKGAPA